MAEKPAKYLTFNQSLCAIRHARGVRGPESVRSVARSGIKRTLPPLPESSYVAPELFELDASRILVLSDLHLPFQDSAALEAALRHGDSFKPNAILVNGDLLDFYLLSRFDKDPTMPKVSEELAAAKSFWRHVAARFPRAKRFFKLGNHDARFASYIFQVAPLLADIPEIVQGWQGPAGIVESKVVVIDDKRPIMAGKLMILHGHEKGRGIANPVNPARGAFLRLLTSVLEGHGHQQSEHTERTAADEQIVCRSTGCLCGLKPRYATVNKWSHGAATVVVEKSGDYAVNPFRIINGKVYG